MPDATIRARGVQSQFLCALFAHQQYRSRAITDLRRVAGGVDMAFDDRLEPSQRFCRRLTQSPVASDSGDLTGRHAFLVHHGSLDGHDLAVEASFCPSLSCAALRFQTERVDVGARDPTLLGNSLRGGELVTHVDGPVVRVRVSRSRCVCLTQEHTLIASTPQPIPAEI